MKRNNLFLLMVFSLGYFQLPYCISQSAGFYVKGRDLYDKCGEKVILKGVNKMSYWDENDPDGSHYFPEIRKTNANCVRIVWTTDGAPSQMDLLIQNCINNKMIPIIELHDATGDWSKLPLLANYWKRPDVIQVLKRHSSYLLINIGNEVGDHGVYSEQFVDDYRPIILQFRNLGIQSPLMIDAPGFGKELDILNFSAAALLAADPVHNLLFSVHLYYPKYGGAPAAFIKDKLQNAARYNYPLVIGEFSKYGAWVDGVETQCGQQNEVEYQAIMEVCNQLGLGWLVWSWGPGNAYGGDPLCSAMDLTSNGTLASLQPGWATEVVLTSPYSIKNTALTPISISTGNCANTSPTPSPSNSPTGLGKVPTDRAQSKIGNLRNQNKELIDSRALGLSWGPALNYVQDGATTIGAIYGGGAIFIDASGQKTFILYGLIFDKWVRLGGYRVVGRPITDEMPCHDGRGRFNHFQHDTGGISSIYWTPQTGPQYIYGAIRETWASLGWEQSKLGYPTTDEINGDYPEFERMNRFEGGRIYWSRAMGTKVIYDKRID